MPVFTDEQRKEISELLALQRHSYDYTERLTFYVIGVEAAFCGYVLLNAKTLAAVRFLPHLFFVTSVAVLMGILWRYAYNESYHHRAHANEPPKGYLAFVINHLLPWTYNIYIVCTLLFLVSVILLGSQYLARNLPTFQD